jgi:hypothetical protein
LKATRPAVAVQSVEDAGKHCSTSRVVADPAALTSRRDRLK